MSLTRDEFTSRFQAILTEMYELMKKKNHDYAGDTDPLSNFRLCEKAGISAWKGICAVRMCDKMSRILNFSKSGELKVKDESLKDTLRDIANYAILAMIAYEDENGQIIKKVEGAPLAPENLSFDTK